MDAKFSLKCQKWKKQATIEWLSVPKYLLKKPYAFEVSQGMTLNWPGILIISFPSDCYLEFCLRNLKLLRSWHVKFHFWLIVNILNLIWKHLWSSHHHSKCIFCCQTSYVLKFRNRIWKQCSVFPWDCILQISTTIKVPWNSLCFVYLLDSGIIHMKSALYSALYQFKCVMTLETTKMKILYENVEWLI